MTMDSCWQQRSLCIWTQLPAFTMFIWYSSLKEVHLKEKKYRRNKKMRGGGILGSKTSSRSCAMIYFSNGRTIGDKRSCPTSRCTNQSCQNAVVQQPYHWVQVLFGWQFSSKLQQNARLPKQGAIALNFDHFCSKTNILLSPCLKPVLDQLNKCG